MTQTALVSVIIPTHNRARLAVEAVDSVLRQTHPAVEAIVVDDGSTDGTGQVLARTFDGALRDGRVVYCRHPSSLGRSCARNRGIVLARGSLIAFLDDDDLYLPEHLARCVAALRRHDAVAAGIVQTDLDRRPLPPFPIPFRRRLSPNELVLLGLWMTNSNAVVRREMLARVGAFRDGMEQGEDIDFWMRVALRGSIGLLKHPTVLRRVHQRHYTADEEEAHRIRFGDGLETMLRANSREAGVELSARLLGYLHLYLARTMVCRGEHERALGRLRQALRHWRWLPAIEPQVWAVLGRAFLLRHAALHRWARRTRHICQHRGSAS